MARAWGYYLLIALGLSLIFSVAASSIWRMARSTRSALMLPSKSRNISVSAPAVVLSPVAVRPARHSVRAIHPATFYNADPILSLLVTFGIAMVTEQAIRIVWGPSPLSASIPLAFRGSVFLGDSCFRGIGCSFSSWSLPCCSPSGYCCTRPRSAASCVPASSGLTWLQRSASACQAYMTAIVMLGVGWRRSAARSLRRSRSCILRWCRNHNGRLCRRGDRRPGRFWGVVIAALLVGVWRGVTIHFVPAAGEASIYILMFLGSWCGRASARRADREVRMTISTAERLRPLLLAALALVALPFALRASGCRSIPASIRGRVDRRHGAQSCIATPGCIVRPQHLVRPRRLCAGLIQLHVFPGEIWLPLLLAAVIVALSALIIGAVILRRRGVYFSLRRWRSLPSFIRPRFAGATSPAARMASRTEARQYRRFPSR